MSYVDGNQRSLAYLSQEMRGVCSDAFRRLTTSPLEEARLAALDAAVPGKRFEARHIQSGAFVAPNVAESPQTQLHIT
jgi:hypothetical protein